MDEDVEDQQLKALEFCSLEMLVNQLMKRCDDCIITGRVPRGQVGPYMKGRPTDLMGLNSLTGVLLEIQALESIMPERGSDD